MNDLVSVIITTYKGANFLKRTILTVVNQSYKNIEIIIVDDNGIGTINQKKTEEVISSINDDRIIYLKHEKNMNGACARNTGLRKANGDFICFLDDDDLLLEDRIKDAVSFLNANKKYDGVFTNVLCCDENLIPSKIVKINKEGNCQKEIITEDMFFGTGSNIFITNKAFQRIGFFDERFKRHQDIEYMIRFYRYFLTGNINKIEIIKSKNGINNIPNYDKMISNEKLYIEVFKKEIEEIDEKKRIEFYNDLNKTLNISKIASTRICFSSIRSFCKLNYRDKILIFVKKTKIENNILFKKINSSRKKMKFNKTFEISNEIRNFIDKYRRIK